MRRCSPPFPISLHRRWNVEKSTVLNRSQGRSSWSTWTNSQPTAVTYSYQLQPTSALPWGRFVEIMEFVRIAKMPTISSPYHCACGNARSTRCGWSKPGKLRNLYIGCSAIRGCVESLMRRRLGGMCRCWAGKAGRGVYSEWLFEFEHSSCALRLGADGGRPEDVILVWVEKVQWCYLFPVKIYCIVEVYYWSTSKSQHARPEKQDIFLAVSYLSYK